MKNGEQFRPARPQRRIARGVRSVYVEGLGEARTTLEDFCSILMPPPSLTGDPTRSTKIHRGSRDSSPAAVHPVHPSRDTE